MKLFNNFSTDIAIDLGTTNTMIMYNNRVVINEPSIIAINKIDGKLVSCGSEALLMHQRSPASIKTIWPLKNGVISNYNAAQHLIRHMIQTTMKEKYSLGMRRKRIAVCVPYCATEVEKRAVRDVADSAGANELFMIHEPIAAAIGMNLDITGAEGNMVIDMGGGTTEFAIISLSGVVCSQSIMEAGQTIDDELTEFVRKKHSLLIGERTAERIKKEIGTALPDMKPLYTKISGRDLITGLPKSIELNSSEVFPYIDKVLTLIEATLLKTLEICPPELLQDICERGIYLTGGCSGIEGLDKRFEKITGIRVNRYDIKNYPVLQGIASALDKDKKRNHLLFK